MFLRTKLLPPRPVPSLLTRPRLMNRLLANLANPVTLVTANAGSGKTTLVAEFVRAHAPQVVWYQLDPADADPVGFLGYLATGLGQVVEGVGATTLRYLAESAGELGRTPERAVDVLLNEVLDLVERHVVIVLDDYHHIGSESLVHRAVDRLLAYLPDVLHIVIISRDTPPLGLARLRSKASLEIVDRDDLLFTDDETLELFRSVFGLELSVEQMAQYRERTQGWITALQLVRQMAQRRAFASGQTEGAPDLLEVLRQSERDIFEYFAEEVFADEPGDVQTFLTHVSLLDRLDATVCAELVPESDPAALLPQLVRRNVFLTVAGDGRGEEYRLHPLFHAFLRKRLRAEVGAEGVKTGHRRIAQVLLGQGNWEQAMSHLVAAEDFDKAASIVAREGERWIAAGALAALAAVADALPATALDRHPRTLFYRAEVARLQGDFETAGPLLHRAIDRFEAMGDKEGEAEAHHALATLARRAGDFASALDHLDRAVALSEPDAAVRTRCGNTRGLILKDLGRWTDAESEFQAALQLAEQSGDEQYVRILSHNLGLPAMMRGDFSEALRWLRRLARGDRAVAPMPQEAVANLNIARCLLYRGEAREGEAHLDRALELCQTFNLTALFGEVFETYGNLFRDVGDAARAAEFYDRAARAYETAGIDATRRELLEEQALLRLRTGDVAGALALLDRLASAREAAGDDLARRTVGLTRGRVLAACEQYEAARKELDPALSCFHANSLYYYEAQASLALAACDGAAGREHAALAHLRRTVDLVIRYDFEHWLSCELRNDPRPFLIADGPDLLPPDLRELVGDRAPARVPEPLKVVESDAPAPDLTINLLGAVDIFRDPARPFAPEAWTTRRSRDILCFIAAQTHHRASKDAIIDTFWEDSEFEAVEKNFHPTMSHIRKALNSRQVLKQNFLVYRDGHYQLVPEYSYRIDVHEFDRLIERADDAHRARREHEKCAHLEAAVALYRGEFLEGCYDDWVQEPRSYYRERYLQALETLAAAAAAQDEWIRVLSLATRILKDDPFREDVHCLAMRAHAALGNRAAVREQYTTIRRLLDDELGVAPSASTKKLFEELMD